MSSTGDTSTAAPNPESAHASAVRQVLKTEYIALDPRHTFAAELPAGFLDGDQRQGLLTQVWQTDVRASINAIFKFRNSLLVDRRLRATVFESKLHQVCLDFSRRTENVKVSLVQTHKEKTGKTRIMRTLRGKQLPAKPKLQWQLRIVKLSPIHAEQRNIAFCTAEIPTRIPDPVQAQRVGTAIEADSDTTTVTAVTIPVQDILVEAPGYRRVVDIDNDVHQEEATTTTETYYYNEDNPPLAADVMALEEEDSERLEANPSILTARAERMEELESIRSFLSETDYDSIRQNIFHATL